MVYRFSSANASEKTKCDLKPRALQTRAIEIPVVPAVYSTTVPPAGSRPAAAARSTIARAIRSFMLPVGLADSSFAITRAAPRGTMRRSSTTGVRPIASSTLLASDMLILQGSGRRPTGPRPSRLLRRQGVVERRDAPVLGLLDQHHGEE